MRDDDVLNNGNSTINLKTQNFYYVTSDGGVNSCTNILKNL